MGQIAHVPWLRFITFGCFLVLCHCRCQKNLYGGRNVCSVAKNRPDEYPTWPYANTKISGFLPPVCFKPGFYEGDCPHYCERDCRKGDKRVCYRRINVESTKTNNPHACSSECVKDNSCAACIDLDGVENPVQAMNYRVPELLPDNSFYHNVQADMKTFAAEAEMEHVATIAKTLYERNFDPFHKWRNLVHADKELFASTTGKERSNLGFLPTFTKVGDPTAIHWHGNKMTYTMGSDGVPIATQKPIEPGQCYRYKMVFDQGGTYFYHSHVGIQRGQGMFGPLIIGHRKDPNCKEYDKNDPRQNIIATDFGHNLSHQADNILLNSHGCFLSERGWIGQVTVLTFSRGCRQSLHFIYNGITSAKLLCWIDKHPMKIIAVDANNVKPVVVNKIVMANGERVQVVINTNQNTDNYLLHCVSYTNHSLHNVAVIHYENAPRPPTCKEIDFTTPVPEGLEYNTPDVGAGTPGSVVVSELHGYKRLCKPCRRKNVRQIFLDFSVSRRGFQINNITNDVEIYPMLDQIYEKGELDTSNFCNAETLKAQGRNCENETCVCTHVYQLKLGDCVEIIAFKPHPLHLHGHMFHEVARGTLDVPVSKEAIQKADREHKIKRNLIDPPEKDVALLPRNGFAALRFCADNAGIWILHCHIEIHGISGMSLFFVEGTVKDILKKKEIYHNTTAVRNNYCYDDHKDSLNYQ